MAIKPDDLDLNLIPYLVAIEETRNVSRAAERLGVSQPRVSTALGRLRAHFNDPLFVRTSRGMDPTPRALALVPAAREALNRIERGLLDTPHFDPANATGTFSIALSDVGEIVFLPRLLQALATTAPNANLRSVSARHDQVGARQNERQGHEVRRLEHGAAADTFLVEEILEYFLAAALGSHNGMATFDVLRQRQRRT